MAKSLQDILNKEEELSNERNEILKEIVRTLRIAEELEDPVYRQRAEEEVESLREKKDRIDSELKKIRAERDRFYD